MKIAPERLAEIWGRCEKATEGPWSGRNSDRGVPFHWDLTAPCSERNPIIGSDMLGSDAAFCSHARSDIPDLLAALEVAVEALEEVEIGYLDPEVPAGIASKALQQIGWREKT